MRQAAKLLVPIFTILATLTFASQARAGSVTGYICKVNYYTPESGNNGTYGTYGMVEIHLYSAPSCGGTNVLLLDFCSTGAANSNTCDTAYLFPEQMLSGLYQNAQRAADSGQKVTGTQLSGKSTGSSLIFGVP